MNILVSIIACWVVIGLILFFLPKIRIIDSEIQGIIRAILIAFGALYSLFEVLTLFGVHIGVL